MTPIQSALEDLQFMKDKSIDPFAEIIWGMAITIVKEHSPESSCSLCMKYREALEAILKEPFGCGFCDSGKLRNPKKEHNDDCGFYMAQKLASNALK